MNQNASEITFPLTSPGQFEFQLMGADNKQQQSLVSNGDYSQSNQCHNEQNEVPRYMFFL